MPRKPQDFTNPPPVVPSTTTKEPTFAEKVKTLKAMRDSLVPEAERKAKKAENERVRLHNEIATAEHEMYERLINRAYNSEGNDDLWDEIDKVRETIPDFDPKNPRDPIVSLSAEDFNDLIGEEGFYDDYYEDDEQ